MTLGRRCGTARRGSESPVPGQSGSRPPRPGVPRGRPLRHLAAASRALRRAGGRMSWNGTPSRSRENRAQAFMPRHHVGQGGFQGIVVEGSLDTQRHRDIVSGVRSLQSVEEPEPLLRERQRQMDRAAAAVPAEAGSARPPASESRARRPWVPRRRCGSGVRRRDWRVPADDACRQQRVARRARKSCRRFRLAPTRGRWRRFCRGPTHRRCAARDSDSAHVGGLAGLAGRACRW